MSTASHRPLRVLWATIILWGALLLVIWALATYAHADECNPDLVSSRTPLCQLYKPQHRQCRPDEDLDLDMDLLDNLCASCPPGQCLTGITLSGAPLCTPCGGCAGFFQCPPPTVVIGHDANCNDICSSDFCTPNPCANGGICILQGNGFACLCPCGCTGTLCETCGVTTTTTTSTTVTTGTGSTTTVAPTTTTSTTLPLFPSTTFAWEPVYPTLQSDTQASLAAQNTPICVRAPEIIGIQNATKMAGILATSCTFPFRQIDYGIYPDDDNATFLARIRQDCSGAAGLRSQTGLAPFTLTAGTVYRFCVCVESGGGGPVGSYGSTTWLSNGFAGEANAFATSVGTATNLCGAGVGMPATTGALTPNAAVGAPIIFISRE